jgi:hypothetical protein
MFVQVEKGVESVVLWDGEELLGKGKVPLECRYAQVMLRPPQADVLR